MRTIHKNLAQGRWHQLSLAEQMGNIGSEVGRAIKWHKKGDQEYFQSAFSRALELFNLTVTDPRWHNHRLKEITRAREVFRALFYDKDEPKASSDSLENYFLHFAVAARKKSA